MTTPVIRTYVDWDDATGSDPDHDFTADTRARMRDTIMTPLQVTRGRSLDFSGDATGQLTFRIKAGRKPGCYPRQVLMTPGLVGYWTLGEASGTTAGDLAGPNDGTYVATPTLGATGPLTGDTTTAATFASASSEYVTIAYAAELHPGDTFSLSAWLKRTASGHLDYIVTGGASDYAFSVGSDDKVYLSKQGVSDVWVSTSTYTDTNWHHLVATKTGATIVVYRDGAVIAGTTTNATIVASATTTQIGAAAGASFANATIAHVAIWDRVLTAAEVTELYTAGTTAPLFAAYDKIGRGDVMLGRRILVLADYGATTDEPVFSGRIVRMYRDPVTYDIEVVAQDDLAAMTRTTPAWQPFEGTHRELRAQALRRGFDSWRNMIPGTYPTTLLGSSHANWMTIQSTGPVGTGDIIRFSGEIKSVSGATGLTGIRIGVYDAGGTARYVETAIAPTDTFSTFDVSYPVGPTVTDERVVQYGFTGAATSGSWTLQNVMLTLGPMARPYTAAGYPADAVTFCDNRAWRNPNGGASRAWWTSVPVNRVTNPSFETDTTGWNITTDGTFIVNAAASITRTATGHDGSWMARVVGPVGAALTGAWTPFTALSFLEGVTYRATCWMKAPAGIPVNIVLHSSGTPADQASDGAVGDGAWQRIEVAWTPTANRTDVRLALSWTQSSAETVDIDGFACWYTDSIEGDGSYELRYYSPLCLSSTATKEAAITRVVGTGPYGLGTYLRATASSKPAIAMPFQAPGDWTGTTTSDAIETFLAGTYTATVWAKGTGTGKLSFGSQQLAAATDTVTLSSSWQQLSATKTLTADATDVWVVVESDTGTTIDVGGLVVTQGSTAWDYVPSFIDITGMDTAEDAFLVPRITPAGTPLGVLTALNTADMSRHWCEPTATYPWWRYRSRALSSIAAMSVAETYDDDVASTTAPEESYDSLMNVAYVESGLGYFDATTGNFAQHTTTTWATASDATSVAAYGAIEAQRIQSDYLENMAGGSTAMQTIADYIVATYAYQRKRLNMVVQNRLPSQMTRALDDLIVLNAPLLGIVGGRFIITGITHDITSNGFLWTTTYQLEEAP